MTVIRANFPDLNNANLTDVAFQGYTDHPSLIDTIFNVESSNRATEYYSAVSGLALPTAKAEGTDMDYDAPIQLYDGSVTHTTVAQGVRLTMEAMADDEKGILGQRLFSSMGRGFGQYRETAGANVFNRAFNASYTGPDGATLCSTTHPKNPDEATTYILNRPSTDVDLSVSSLKSALTTFRNMTDERGLRFMQTPKYLLVPSDLEWTAKEILGSALEPYVNDNTKNVLANSLQLLVWPFLTDTDAWFILSDKMGHTLTWYWRMKFTVKKDNDFDTWDAKYGAAMRLSTTWKIGWKGVYGTQGA